MVLVESAIFILPRMPVELLSSFDTTLCAAVCQYNPSGNLLLCGTYELQQQTRIGELLVYRSDCTSGSLLLDSRLKLPGILDLQYFEDFTAVVLADGTIRTFRVHDPLIDSACTEEIQKISVSSGLCLAAALNFKGSSRKLGAVSDSNGVVTILDGRDEDLQVLNQLKRHAYEAWSVCWDSEDDQVLYSGGDDSLMVMTDLRSNKASTTAKHDAGVTSIVSHPGHNFHILTGSYDENIRCWDKRSLNIPVSSLKLGGGVWKIKVNEEMPGFLLCACMQGGCRILQFRNGEFRILEDCMRDRELVYGVDWCPRSNAAATEKPGETRFKFVGCSFYDHVLDLFSATLSD